ncbi:MAG: hypothetical protein IJQ21_07475 [Lachnospiraceae bacterium]|nr:hypothetical protein [Lachnospiraceae bacterium]
MNGLLVFIWLVIILVNLFVRAMKRRNENASGQMTARPAAQRTASGMQMNRAGMADARMNPAGQSFSKKKVQVPVQPQMQTYFTGRDDLEPGYMYLNGVKVLIKEADRLEFLR